MRVACEVEETTLENCEGREVDGVMVTCGRCGNTAEAFGTSEASVRRCCAQLRETCPRGEINFYVTE